MKIDIVEDLRADELPDERQSVREARIVLHKKLNAAADEIERLRNMVRDAYNAGFFEGMREHTSSKGGIPWSDSKFKKGIK